MGISKSTAQLAIFCDLYKKVSSERSHGLCGMQNGGDQDSSSPQGQVHSAVFKMGSDISMAP